MSSRDDVDNVEYPIIFQHNDLPNFGPVKVCYHTLVTFVINTSTHNATTTSQRSISIWLAVKLTVDFTEFGANAAADAKHKKETATDNFIVYYYL